MMQRITAPIMAPIHNMRKSFDALPKKRKDHILLLIGAAFIAVACAMRAFDSPVRNPMLYGAPHVFNADYSLSRMGMARACAFYSWVEHLLGAAISGIVALVLLGGWKRIIPELKSFDWKDWVAMLYVSVGGSALGLYFYLMSMTLGKPVVAILFQQLQPAVTIAAAAIFLRERPTWFFVFPLILSIAGVLLLAIPDFISAAKGTSWIKPASGSTAVLADVFSLISTALWGISTVGGRVLTKKVSYWDLVFLRYFGGFLFLIVFAACNVTYNHTYFHYLFHGHAHVFGYTDSAGTPVRAYYYWPTLGSVFYGTIISGGVIPLILYYFGLRLGPAAIAGLCELAFPAASIFVNDYWLNYGLDKYQIAGAVCVMLGVLAVAILGMSGKATSAPKEEIPLAQIGEPEVLVVDVPAVDDGTQQAEKSMSGNTMPADSADDSLSILPKKPSNDI